MNTDILQELKARSKGSWVSPGGDKAMLFVDIDPELAARLLEARPGTQRNIRDAAVARYRSDMERDDYVWTGACINLTAEGRLINGQHRLVAAAGSGFTLMEQPVAITELDVYKWIDLLRTRDRNDAVMYDADRAFTKAAQAGIIAETADFKNHVRARLSILEQARIVSETPFYDAVVEPLQKCGRINGGIIAAALRAARANPAAAGAFFSRAWRNEHEIGGVKSVALQLAATQMLTERPSSNDMDGLARLLRAFVDWYSTKGKDGLISTRGEGLKPRSFYRPPKNGIYSVGEMEALHISDRARRSLLALAVDERAAE